MNWYPRRVVRYSARRRRPFIPIFARQREPKAAQVHPPPTEKELAMYKVGRIKKAERDERMDITMALTPPKTYHLGFTRPRDLRSTNWWKGGAYVLKGKVYESPLPAAYTSHTVYLLETRYPVQYGIGRPDAVEHMVGICKAGDLPLLLKMYNSPKASQEMKKAMDNARWPFVAQRSYKQVQWWEEEEDHEQILKNIREDGTFDGLGEKTQVSCRRDDRLIPRRRTKREIRIERDLDREEAIAIRILEANPHLRRRPSSIASGRIRLYSTWIGTKSSLAAEEQIDERPEKETQGVSERVEEESLLKETTDVGFGMRRPTNKIPFEYENNGDLEHPSGFVVPSPGNASAPITDRRPREDKRQSDAVKEMVEAASSLSEASTNITAQESKIPVEFPTEDGNVIHPSGFVPPTPSTSFVRGSGPKGTRSYATHVIHPDFPDMLAAAPEAPSSPEASEAAEPAKKDTKAKPILIKSVEIEKALQSIKTIPPDIQEIRDKYTPLLKDQPFWRPILAITFTTRPLALSVLRLARAREQGTPFYAAVDNHDRKYSPSFSARMRHMYVNRLLFLARKTSKLLAGERGGFVGIRFGVTDRGRGINGEGMADPIPFDNRLIKVAVGEWFEKAEELKEIAAKDIQAVEVVGMNEWGRTLDASGNVVQTEGEDENRVIEQVEEDEPDDVEETQEIRA